MEKRNQRGYIAISIAIVLTFVSFIVVKTLSDYAIHHLANVRMEKSSQEARAYANACTEFVLADIASSSLQTANSNIVFTNGSCQYTLTSPTANTRTINASGFSANVVRKNRVSVTLGANLSITEWLEVP